MRRERARREIWGANTVLVSSGAVCVVVAIIGLFVRASPTLSGLFLIVGSAMLVIAVFERRTDDSHSGRAPSTRVDADALERSARAAESDVARGRLRPADEVLGP